MKVNIYKEQKEKTKTNQKVSVIIPNYNYEKYIIERIDSILLQTIPIYELIILDDASTDNSVEIIKDKVEKIKEEYPDIKVKMIFNQKNSGGCIFAQWQKGLKEATGDYIWIAEADDSAHTDFLKTALENFKKNKNVILFYSESKRIDGKNNIIALNCQDWCDIFHTKRWEQSFINNGVEEIKNYLSNNNTILNVSSVVWKNVKELYTIFEEAKDYKIAGDWYIYSRVLELGDIAFSNKALNYFRKHGSSASTLSIRDKEYKEVYKIQEMIRNKYQLEKNLVEKQIIRRRMMGYIENEKNIGKKGNVAWFVPALLKGGGGHRTIFQNINALIKDGYHCDVYIGDFNRHTPQELFRMINEYYGEFYGDVFSDWNNVLKEYDCLVATSWNSAPIVKKISCEKKAYFIQDFEPYFYPIGSTYIEAENTYKYNFQGITIGKWLSHKMREEYNLKANYFSFCADLNIYKKLKNTKKEEAICFIFQPDKPRRCDNIALKALQIVKKIKPDVKIYLYGSKPYVIKNLEVEQLGIISIEKCNELYNKCMVGLCMSASNPSRIPFEMMAAGLPVVELYKENNLYDFPEKGVILSDSEPEAIAASILKILEDKKLQEEMSKSGINYMKNYPLEKGFEEFLLNFNQYFENKNSQVQKIEQSYTKLPFKSTKETQKISLELPEITFFSKELPKNRSIIYRGLRKIKRMIIKNH